LKKKILLAVVALVALCLLGGGGFVAYRRFFARKPAPATASAAAPQAAPGQGDDDLEAPSGEEKEGGGGSSVMELKQLIVNLDSAHKNAFLKCDLHILFRDPGLAKLATSDKATPENSVIRAVVLQSLSGKTVEEAMDVETRETLRQEIKDKLNEKFANWHSKEVLDQAKKTGKPPQPPIKDILVVDWAIQQ